MNWTPARGLAAGTPCAPGCRLALAASVQGAGLPVHLVIDGDLAELPATVDVSVYRIVQEALTNVLKHAGPARADVTIGCGQDAVTIEVTDNGTAEAGYQIPTDGHGLAGMRERAAVFGGALAASVQAAGLPVNLVISGDRAALPAAVNVSVYRIVQEALTNVLKHAGPARADVTIGCAEEAVTIEVIDEGTGEPGHQSPAGGHGLAGMRERAAVFGGSLAAGPRSGGGYAVRARLPLGDGLPSGMLS